MRGVRQAAWRTLGCPGGAPVGGGAGRAVLCGPLHPPGETLHYLERTAAPPPVARSTQGAKRFTPEEVDQLGWFRGCDTGACWRTPSGCAAAPPATPPLGGVVASLSHTLLS